MIENLEELYGFTLTDSTPNFEIHNKINNGIERLNSDGKISNFKVTEILNQLEKKNNDQLINIVEAVLYRIPFLNENAQDSFSREVWAIKSGFINFLSENTLKKYSKLSDDELFKITKKVINYNVEREEGNGSINLHYFLSALHSKFKKNGLPEAYKPLIKKYYDHYIKYFIRPNNTWRLLSDLLEINSAVDCIKEKFDPDFGKGKLLRQLKGNFPLFEDSPYKDAHLLIEQLVKDNESGQHGYEIKAYPSFKEISALKSREEIKNAAMAILYRVAFYSYNFSYERDYRLAYAFAELIRKKLPFNEKEIITFYKGLRNGIYDSSFTSPLLHFKAVEAHIKEHGLSGALKEQLLWFSENGTGYYNEKSIGKLKQKIDEIIGLSEGKSVDTFFALSEDDNFGKTVNEALKEHKNNQLWYRTLKFAGTASGAKPTKKFTKSADELIQEFNKNKVELTKQLNEWFAFISSLETTARGYYYSYLLQTNNQDVVKGLVWLSSRSDQFSDLHQNLYKLCIKCFTKIQGVGPAATGLGNACIYALYANKSLESISILTKLRLKIRQKNTRSLIEKYIANAAEELGVSKNMIEDMSVQEYDLIDGGQTYHFNDYQLKIQIERIGKVSQQWIKPDGKLQKSVPAFVKKDFADELKSIKTNIKEIQQMLSVQRDRLDRSYIQKNKLSYQNFKKYYLDHGLMSYLSKRLIWCVEKEEEQITVFWNNGWQTVSGQKIDWIDNETSISLWHPVMVSSDEVIAWRNFMEENQIVQPFKQAFREVYILTDAEVNTRFYSNRMAAHLLKQHQFNSLATIRNWRYSLLGSYDDGREDEIAYIHLNDYDMRAEFWINEVYEEDAFNDAGIWLYVATDQVRFLNTQSNNTVDLINVPKLVFSEIMRDVDLFVGVASVGNDPQWADNSGNPQHRDYWMSYSFGNLTETAKIRKTILEKLLPKLKIAKVAEIEGKYLKVKGTRTTYKIHIGSTNILMEPNDQYLCIVPQRKTATNNNVFLPFEGDRGFSILLSKAFLLAEDDKITDTTILSQLPK